MPDKDRGPPWYRRLAVQILIFLSIALLPIGLISVSQTREVTEEANAVARLSLLAATERAVFDERAMIESAFGAARALAEFADRFIDDPEVCQARLATLVEGGEMMTHASLVLRTGRTVCSSSGRLPNIAGAGYFSKVRDAITPTVALETGGADGATAVISVFHPFSAGERAEGFVSISLPHVSPEFPPDLPGPRLLAATTFDAAGTVLSSNIPQDILISELPAHRALPALTAGNLSFRAENANGTPRAYTVVPIVSNTLFALTIWDPTPLNGGLASLAISPILFPLLMWLASLVVAMFAMNRLVVRHVRDLGTRMRRFAADRKLHAIDPPFDISAELIEINSEFESMAHGILHDEAVLLDTVRSKNVLIKEVHHRVKNNLQLIASIMNIQMRQTTNEETGNVVRRLQERVLSLATIHENLYQLRERGRVDAARLLQEIVLANRAKAENRKRPINLKVDIDTTMLFPDQAAPLSLLVSEIMRNALDYNGPDESGESWIELKMSCQEFDCSLTIRNSVDPALSPPARSKGIGALLTRAFASQLGGTLKVDAQPRSYTVNVRFKAMEFLPENTDF